MGKKYTFVFIGVILLVWALGATGMGIYLNRQYHNLHSIIATSGEGWVVELVKQQRDTIVSLQDDLGAVRGELESAIGRAESAERSIGRAYAIAERADAELAELGSAMAVAGGTIQEAIQRQQRINELALRLRGNNTAIKMELGMRP